MLVTSPGAAGAQDAGASVEAVYEQYCASCHDQVSPRIPPRAALQQLPAARILRTLDFGVMMNVAYPIRRIEREAVARLLGTPGDDTVMPAGAFCGADRRVLSAFAPGWGGWSPTAANLRFQPREAAGLTAADVGKLELKWAFGFRSDIIAFAAPTLVDGTLFVGSASGTIHAIDAASGCLHWMYQANGPVRAAPVAVRDGGRLVLLFGDQIGWVYALDARSGAVIWMRRVEEHEATRLTGAPAVHDGVVFVPAASWEETRAIDPQYPCCTFRGSVTALRVRDGADVWKQYMVDPPRRTGATGAGTATFGPSGAGIWSTPTVDAPRGVLYVTTGDNYSHPATATSDAVIALDLKSGRIVWTQQTTPNDVYNSACGRRGANCPPDSGPDHDYGAAAMLVRTAGGRDVIVAGQKSGVVYALDPDRRGRILWQARVGNGGVNGGVQWGMASDGRAVYASVSDAVRLPAAPNAPPLGDAMFDPVRGGGLTALRVEDGEKLWFVAGRPCEPPRPGCSPAQSGALTAIPGAVFSGSLDGHLRAFSTDDGRVLWDLDTAKTYVTVNGVDARGGSLDGAGPVVAGGMVFVNSGYPRFGGMPGNVLLGFGVPARGAAAQQSGDARVHFSHVATAFPGAPGGRGLVVTTAMEVNTAMMYANFAAGSLTDLEAMKTNVGNVLHALVPEQGSQGPGLGFGVRRAAEAVVTHIELAVKSPGASATLRTLGPHVAQAGRAVAARAQKMAALGSQVLAAQTAAQAAPLVEQLRALALELDLGNGSEPGMSQLEAAAYAILEGDKLPRVLR